MNVTALPVLAALIGVVVRVSARRAVNALLGTDNSDAGPCEIWELYRPPEMEPLKRFDELRYKLGLPNTFDLGQARPERTRRKWRRKDGGAAAPERLRPFRASVQHELCCGWRQSTRTAPVGGS